MALAADDKRFLTGLAVAAALLAVYFGPVRLLLRGRAVAVRAQITSLRLEHKDLFGDDARPAADVERSLAAHLELMTERWGALQRAIEFDTASVLGPLDAGADPNCGAAAYLELSRSLHAKIQALRERQTKQLRVPGVFDPQGEVRAPVAAARVPHLHRRLVASYVVLRCALEASVDVIELGPAPASEGTEAARLAVSVRGRLKELAAFLHAVSATPTQGLPSSFLSLERIDVARSPGEPELLRATMILAAVQGGKP